MSPLKPERGFLDLDGPPLQNRGSHHRHEEYDASDEDKDVQLVGIPYSCSNRCQNSCQALTIHH